MVFWNTRLNANNKKILILKTNFVPIRFIFAKNINYIVFWK